MKRTGKGSACLAVFSVALAVAAPPVRAEPDKGVAPVPAPGDPSLYLGCRDPKSSERDFDVRELQVTAARNGEFLVSACLVTRRTDVKSVSPTFYLFDREGRAVAAMGQPRDFETNSGAAGARFHCSAAAIAGWGRTIADLHPQLLLLLTWKDSTGTFHSSQTWLPYRVDAQGLIAPFCSDGPHGDRNPGSFSAQPVLPVTPVANFPSPPATLPATPPSLAHCLDPKGRDRAVEIRDLRVTPLRSAVSDPANSRRVLVEACAVSNDPGSGAMSVNFRLFRRDGMPFNPDGQTYQLGPGTQGPLGAPPIVVPIAAELVLTGVTSLLEVRPEMIVHAFNTVHEDFVVPFVIPR